MVEHENNSSQKLPNNTVIKEEVNLQFHWYLFGFFVIYYSSYIFPGVLFFLYLLFIYIPFYLETANIISLFTEVKPLIGAISLPFVILTCYFLYLFILALTTRYFWNIAEKKSPSKEGIIPRNIRSKTLNYYHIRSFLIRYSKNTFQKGAFPWLLNWFYNFVGSNKIGTGTTIEEQFGADKFITVGDNSYIGVNSGFSSHSVEGIFGNISYFKIRLGDNVTTAGLNCVAPGVTINDNSYLFPLASATKHSNLKGNNFYYGVPLRKIFKRKIMKYLDISEDELKKTLEFRKNQEKNKE